MKFFAILREQLSGTRTAAELEEVGTVLQVGGGKQRIYGLSQGSGGEIDRIRPMAWKHGA